MKSSKRIVLSFFWLVLGIILFILGLMNKVDEYWSGMGGGFLAVGVLQLIRFWRLHNNLEYKERMEIEVSDERNHFIRNKAWAWAGYLFVLIAAVCTIGFQFAGQELLSTAAGTAVCLIITLYWISFMILKKKY